MLWEWCIIIVYLALVFNDNNKKNSQMGYPYHVYDLNQIVGWSSFAFVFAFKDNLKSNPPRAGLGAYYNLKSVKLNLLDNETSWTIGSLNEELKKKKK